MLADCSCCSEWLTAAAYAAAWTAHNFNKLIVCFSCTNLIHQNSCILQTVCNSNLNWCSIQIQSCFLDAFMTSACSKVEALWFFSGNNLVYGTDCSLHYTAGSTEDCTSTGTKSQRMVKFFLWQEVKVQSSHTDHLCKLAGGQNNIDILIAGRIHFWTLTLIFLCDTRHDRNNKHLVTWNAHLISIVSFCDCTEHLLWGFAGRNMWKQIRIGLFHKVDPTWAARGNHWQSTAILHTVKQLVTFFHNGQVSREIGIEYFVKAQSAQSSNHLTGCNCAALHAKFFTDCYTNSWSGLNNNKFIFIVDCIPNTFGVIFFIQCTNWTYCNTLSAVYARRFAQWLLKCGCDLEIGGTSAVTDCIGCLNCLTSLYTTTAANTFCHIANQSWIAQFFWNRFPNWIKDIAADIIFCCQSLKFTFAVSFTMQTILWMVCKQQLQNGLTSFSYLWRIGGDVACLINQVVAGSFQSSAVTVFYQTYTTECADSQVRMVAQGWNFNTDFSCGFHNCGTGWHGYRNTVNVNCNHLIWINMHTGHHTFCYLNKPDKCR